MKREGVGRGKERRGGTRGESEWEGKEKGEQQGGARNLRVWGPMNWKVGG